MAEQEEIPPEWGWPKEPFSPEDLRQYVLKYTQASQQEQWDKALEARALDSKLEDHMAEKVYANVLLNKEGTGEEKTGRVYEGIDPHAYSMGRWYRFLNHKGDCYVFIHNYTQDVTATRPVNFTELTEEEQRRLAQLGIHIRALPDEIERVYDYKKVIPIIFGSQETCEALTAFSVYDKNHKLLDATKLSKRITSGALEDCRKAIVAALTYGKTLMVYCGDSFPDFTKVCVPKNKDTFPVALFTYGAMDNETVREKIYRDEDKEAGQCVLRPGFKVCLLVMYDGMNMAMSSMRREEELPQKVPNLSQMEQIRCYSDADQTKVLENMRCGS